MASSALPAMKTKPNFIFFTDFDGTITQKDSNDFLTDNIGYGPAKRREGNLKVLRKQATFRDAFKDMLDSVSAKVSFPECKEKLVASITLDPYFKKFYFWTREHNIPVVVLSSGMVPIIRAVLENLIGPEAKDIQIVANDVKAKPGHTIDEVDGWEIDFHDDSDFGHDKSLTLRPYRALPEIERPTMFYAGDGVSDVSAARETDLLFAKSGYDLVTHCLEEGIPFTLFKSWESIFETTKDIVQGKTTVQKVSEEGVEAVKKGLNIKPAEDDSGVPADEEIPKLR